MFTPSHQGNGAQCAGEWDSSKRLPRRRTDKRPWARAGGQGRTSRAEQRRPTEHTRFGEQEWFRCLATFANLFAALECTPKFETDEKWVDNFMSACEIVDPQVDWKLGWLLRNVWNPDDQIKLLGEKLRSAEEAAL